MERLLYWKYDLLSTSYTYGRYGNTWSPGAGNLKTSGSSTTVTTISSSGVLAPVKVGDLIRNVRDPYISTGVDLVKVLAKASDNSITVNAAVDWDNSAAGYSPWSFLPVETPGTAATDGWVFVGDLEDVMVAVQITTVAAAGGIVVQVEGKTTDDPTATIILPDVTFAVAGGDQLSISDPYPFIRVGVKGGSGFAGTDVFTISIVGKERY